MITKQLIKKVEKFVYSESEKYEVPSKFQIDLANKKGQWLASKLKANKDVVYLGTLLMDSMLGEAHSKGVLPKHVEMSARKAEEILMQDKYVTEDEKENIIHCVEEHHGVKKFYSLESEICCNADCYRFASVEGFLGSLRYTRDMELDEIIDLLSRKADEKWKALSIDLCKKELKPQYMDIKSLLSMYRFGK